MSEAKKLKEVQEVNIPSFNMIKLSPINTLLADKDGTLLFMNDNSIHTLKGLEQYLPDKVENLVGKSIDWFHSNPEHQRKIIANPNNLPHRAVIQFGPEKLDLLVSAITADDGSYIGPMVTWEVVTEKIKLEEEMARIPDKRNVNAPVVVDDDKQRLRKEEALLFGTPGRISDK